MIPKEALSPTFSPPPSFVVFLYRYLIALLEVKKKKRNEKYKMKLLGIFANLKPRGDAGKCF